jgi:NAD(P)-dependent dehydrogenase (short-subunit alcohol dehydrogenase family)
MTAPVEKKRENIEPFDLSGKVAVVTGGTGVLGGAMAKGLARAGAKVAILGRREALASEVAKSIHHDGGEALALTADVLNVKSLQAAKEKLLETYGGCDILVNAAGGNMPTATVMPDGSFFDLDKGALEQVIQLNLLGTILPSQVFGEMMKVSGSIINISSMAAQKPLTRVVGYAASKSAIDNFTKWLAVGVATKYGPGLRVNAIAPGFFVGEQNKKLLLNDDGTLTSRGQQIIDHTPMRRFGEPHELVGTAIWLASDASKFVTGIIVPVDGGFSAYGGV